jgi:hypothetical protein
LEYRRQRQPEGIRDDPFSRAFSSAHEIAQNASCPSTTVLIPSQKKIDAKCASETQIRNSHSLVIAYSAKIIFSLIYFLEGFHHDEQWKIKVTRSPMTLLIDVRSIEFTVFGYAGQARTPVVRRGSLICAKRFAVDRFSTPSAHVKRLLRYY